tara:strand:+ start:18703 stop:19815 length:1113 start_codon:yes stop_codon:yes gene_type:complete
VIKSKNLIKVFTKNKIDFFSGVPDSVLKNFLFNLKNLSFKKHIVAVNEGSAVGIAIGYFLAKKKRACVYMQNSGLGNAINPLISIAHSKVYDIPMVLLIGWRGSPKSKDEPQHMIKGKITLKLLDLLNIKHLIVRKNSDLKRLDKFIKNNKTKTVACLVENNKFQSLSKNQNKKAINSNKIKFIEREFFLEKFLKLIKGKFKIISSTGYTSRAIMKIRKKNNYKHGKDFYLVGGMGHTSSVAIGHVLQSTEKLFCIDGDGSMLMHMGSLFTSGYLKKNNFKYILLNNFSHDSVGGQKTYSENLDTKLLSKSLGFKNFFLIDHEKKLIKNLKNFVTSKSCSFLEVRTFSPNNKNLPRPKSLLEIKKNFLNK